MGTDSNKPSDGTSIDEASLGHPKSIPEAADATSDPEVLGYLWEIIKYRVSEERDRQQSILDRASKYIGYTFSILATLGVALGLASGLLKDALRLNQCTISVLLLFIGAAIAVILITALAALHQASGLLRTQEYRTWNEEDLAKVTLGGEDNERAYFRYLIKATWSILEHNSKVAAANAEKLDGSLQWFRGAIYSAVSLIMLVFLTSICVSVTMSKSPEKPLNVKVSGVHFENDQVLLMASGEKPRPTPTPAPSQGEPIRKSEPEPSRPLHVPPQPPPPPPPPKKER